MESSRFAWCWRTLPGMETAVRYCTTDRGETMLKGFEDAVRLYEVRWREA